jgi:hypothetical protein
MRLLAATLFAALAAVLPASAFGATGYHSACGVELSSDVPSTPGGPTCGSDEGDDPGPSRSSARTATTPSVDRRTAT